MACSGPTLPSVSVSRGLFFSFFSSLPSLVDASGDPQHLPPSDRDFNLTVLLTRPSRHPTEHFRGQPSGTTTERVIVACQRSLDILVGLRAPCRVPQPPRGACGSKDDEGSTPMPVTLQLWATIKRFEIENKRAESAESDQTLVRRSVPGSEHPLGNIVKLSTRTVVLRVNRQEPCRVTLSTFAPPCGGELLQLGLPCAPLPSRGRPRKMPPR